MTDTGAKARLLLVEDNIADATLMVHLFRRANFPGEIVHLSDGAEALDYLRQSGRHADAPPPHLVLLDLNLPKFNGMEILRSLRESNPDSDIPVIVLSTTNSPEDTRIAKDLNVRAVITKPHELEDLEKLVQHLVTVDIPKAVSSHCH